MKVSRLAVALNGRVTTSRYVLFRHPSAVKMAAMSRRQNSTSKERVKASPWTQHTFAPIKVSSDGASWSRESPSTKRTAYIALGSNLGDRIAWIEKACNEMSKRGIHVKRTSSLWETEPMYVLDQENFINGACEVETTLEPLALLDALQEIENSMGRKKFIDKGPRNIDLDILLYDNQVVEHPRLKIPHIGIFEREFVLRPLAELIPSTALNPSSPWKLTQDYLNELPPSEPISTVTPLSSLSKMIHALQSNRKTKVMGILNLTPDSFSDGGLHAGASMETSIANLVGSGATIIDIGGQSSAPGKPDISAEEEFSRILPAIKAVTAMSPRPIISVDTYRAAVAAAAIEAGADIINDVSAGQLDAEMLPVVAKSGKTVCLMHMRGTPATMTKLTDYPNGLIPTIAEELLSRVAEAEAAGIRRWRIILDPGIGFAKTGEQNLEILRRMDELRDWPGLRGLPWLLGSSRKGFIGRITGAKTPNERTWGTAATVVAAIQGGADIVRVHDVKEMVQVAKMSDAIYRV